jgi:hypothetical protein
MSVFADSLNENAAALPLGSKDDLISRVEAPDAWIPYAHLKGLLARDNLIEEGLPNAQYARP